MSQDLPGEVQKKASSPTLVIAGVFIYAAIGCAIFGFLAFR